MATRYADPARNAVANALRSELETGIAKLRSAGGMGTRHPDWKSAAENALTALLADTKVPIAGA